MSKSLVPAMREQEQRNLWSLRWLIVGAFVQGGAVLYLALGADGRAAVPPWAFYAWGVLALAVAALAAIAKAVHPKGGVLNLPLGPAVAPTLGPLAHAAAQRAADVIAADRWATGHAQPEDAPSGPHARRHDRFTPGAAVTPAKLARRAFGYNPQPATPTSPNQPDGGDGGAIPPPPDPDTTPIPVPAPPAPPPFPDDGGVKLNPRPTTEPQFMWGDIGPDAATTAERLAAYSEGLRTTAYQDSGGVWTIGYGHTSGVHAGDTCSEAQATQWLLDDMSASFDAVARLVTVEITDNMRAACADFVFNLGEGNFESSTLLRLLNEGDYNGAADEFPKWVYCDGVVLEGLVIRRDNEQALFLTA